MLFMGILFSVVGVVIEYIFFQDYWNPPLILKFGNLGGLEDLMFGFIAGSFGSVFFNIFFKKKLKSKHNPQYWIIPILLIAQSLSFLIISRKFTINSIYASAIGWFIPTIIIIVMRKDLIKEVFISALLGGLILVICEGLFLICFGSEYLEKYFLLYGKVPIIYDVFPLTELIWGLSFGAIISPLYEFATGKKVVNYQ